MQRRGAVGAGVNDGTERRLLVRVALPFRRGRVTDASTRAARRRDNDDDDGDGVTGDDDDMATGDNGSYCACSFGSLCPCVEVGPLTLRLALRARRRRWQRGGSGARFAHLAWGRAADASARAARRRDDDDDGDGVTGDDDDMATGNNGSRCAFSFGSLCPASRSGHRRFGSRCALAGDGGRGGAAAHASLISRGVGPLTRRLALHAGATGTMMATA